MSFTVVIPARYGSSRLPGKPLLDIGGKPMVQHVYERACESGAERVVIATDDTRIFDAARDFGAAAVMTASEHVSGTDRIQEVCQQLDLSPTAIVVNVQGDEPLIPAVVIDQVADNLGRHDQAGIATLCEPVTTAADLFNPNIVKVIVDRHGYALYFSRAPIPWNRDEFAVGQPAPAAAVDARRHLGIYAYRASFLRKFVSWPPAPMELSESLEQLRAMYHGTRIHVADALAQVPPGVDTEEDLALVRRVISGAS
jgi:3-deoxy-manno-octulosonate cytidylyltransferase (CMP-KDO synthetase)